MPKSREGRLLIGLMVLAAVFLIGRNLYRRHLNAALLAAVQAKNVSAVRSLLEKGADANIRPPHLKTAVLSLVLFPEYGNLSQKDQEIACLLIKHGADIHEQVGLWSYLHAACFFGNVPILRSLLEQGADPNFMDFSNTTPLSNAINYGFIIRNAMNKKEIVISKTEISKQGCNRISREMIRLLRAHGARLTLIQAVELEDIPELTALLKAGIPADPKDENQPTALSAAANLGHLEMIRLLLAYGADVNLPTPSGVVPLGFAASRGHLDAVQLLLDHGAKIDVNEDFETPLENAVWGKHAAVVRLLLAYGANPNFHGPERSASSSLSSAILYTPEVAQDLLAHGADVNAGGGAPLQAAIRSNRPALVRELLARGADINAGNGAPLLAAIRYHRLAPVQELLERGARVRLSPANTKSPPFAPLSAAVRHTPACVEMLLKAGAEVNAADLYGETALTQAVLHAPAKVKTLLEHGANVHAVTQTQHTPLDLAAGQGDLQSVRLLLAHGAKINTRPQRGHTALYWARKHHHADVVALLQKAGAHDEDE